MKITVLGAAGGEVTGSAYYVQTPRAALLVDCGLFQGGRRCETLNRPPTGPRQRLDAVLLTHAHLDHSGRLPLIVERGHRPPVFATPATIEMAGLILRDSARIQEGDAERTNRKRRRSGLAPVAPLYTSEGVEQILACLAPAPYRDPVPVAPGVRALFADSGHMLGSTSIQLVVEEGGKEVRVVFSGDLGPRGVPILRDFEPFHVADMVFLESTYGDRDHRPFAETVEEFVAIVKDAVEKGGKVLVPTFAVGRAQLLLGLLGWMFRTRRIEPFPIFLDSPMAIEATNIYSRHRELFDDGMTHFLEGGSLRDELKTATVCASAEESKKINDQPGPCLILAGAGMCNGGRILHHLRHNLWKPEAHVLIVGYQSRGSLGRQLVEGARSVTIHGEKIAVQAKVHTLNGFSAHAGQSDLLTWFRAVAPTRPRVVLTHGEDGPRQALAHRLREEHGLDATLPAMKEVLQL